MQPLSPPFFRKKRVIFQKTHIFELFIFASSFFRFFCFSMLFPMYFKKHMFHAAVGPLGLSLWPNLAITRAREGQSLRCFPCSFSNFSWYKTCHISKNTYFSTFHFCVVIFGIFQFFHAIWAVLQKHMFHAAVGPLALSLRPNLAITRAREGMFSMFLLKFLSFFGLPERH